MGISDSNRQLARQAVIFDRNSAYMQSAENELNGIVVEKLAGVAILPEDQKIFSMKGLKEKGFSHYKVSKLVDEGKLIKPNKSYYENAEYRGEESDFYYTEDYALKGVICLLSAAVYYNLTTFIPDAVDVAIPRKAKVSTMPDWPQMNVHHYTYGRHELGITTVKEGKNEYGVIWWREIFLPLLMMAY